MEQLRSKSDSCSSRAWVCTCIFVCVPVSERLSVIGSLLLGIRYSRVNFGPPDAKSHCLRRQQLALPSGRVELDVCCSRTLACLLRESHLPIADRVQSTSCSVQGHSHAYLPQAHLCSMEKPHASPEREGRGER